MSALLHRYKEVTVATDYINWDSISVELLSTVCQRYTQEANGQLELTGEQSP